MEMKMLVSCAAMVVIQLAFGVNNILTKVALDEGLDKLVFMVYRNVTAFLLLGPFAYALERKQRPALSVLVLAKKFILSFFGTLQLYVYYLGLGYTSPTVSGAMSNVIPALTFLMAFFLGMEKVSLRSKSGLAKVFGTLTCVGGSLAFTFWKGGYQFKPIAEKPLFHFYAESKHHTHGNWIKGSSLILASYVSWSAMLILQAMIYEIYPARLSINAWVCFFGSLQSSFIAFFLCKDSTRWRLEWNIQLAAIIYGGVVISALVYCVQLWCISNNGPVFAAMFNPLLLFIMAIFSAFSFAEQLHLNSLLGALLIILGLFCVLWGKNMGVKTDETDKHFTGNNTDRPLPVTM